MHILIIGQGISGTMLSWYLHQANIAFTVIDDYRDNSASRVAAGMINPVTGRRIVTTWMIETIMPFALQAYTQFSLQFKTALIQEKPILDFFPSQQMRDAFFDRVKENAPYLSITNENIISTIDYQLGYGTISPSYVVQLASVVNLWRGFLLQKNKLIEITFDEKKLINQKDNLQYDTIEATHIIYANGYLTEESQYWNCLPFAPNKGQALLIKCETLNENFVYKKGISIIPQGNHIFWVGANYEWKYQDDIPTENFKEETVLHLKNILKAHFEIIEHKAGIRPANMERRPFVGFHPLYTNIGILSGMGAKGSSLAPFFAYQLVQNIINQTPITAEADVARFKKILSR